MKKLFIDYTLCFGCHACEVACKQENNLPPGPKWISVKTVGPYQAEGKLKMDFIPMTCMHCANAPCIEACPTEAIFQSKDGVVIRATAIAAALADGDDLVGYLLYGVD